MDAIIHIFGVCGDTHAHFDLLDLLLYGGASVPTIAYIKYKLNTNLILQTARSSNQNHILEIIKNRIFLINKFKEFGHHP